MRSWRGFRNQNKNKVLWYKDKPNYYIAAKTLFSGNTFATDAGSVTIIRFEVIHDLSTPSGEQLKTRALSKPDLLNLKRHNSAGYEYKIILK